MRTGTMASLLAAIAVPVLAGAAVLHVSPREPSCSPPPARRGTGTPTDPYTNPYFVLATIARCGDTVELHGGTYRVASQGADVFPDGTPAERAAGCDDDTTDDGGPTGYDWTRTVLPLFARCPRDRPLVVENAPGEHVVLDGTLADWDRPDLWAPCEAADRCGPARGLHLDDPARTFWTDRLTVCPRAPAACDVQLWIDPTPTTPGRRLGWWANGSRPETIESGNAASHDGFREADLLGQDGALGGRFFAVGGRLVVARLAEATARGVFDPGRHAVRIAGVGYQGGVGAVIAARGGRGITVRRNPAGGTFRVRYGYPVVLVDGGASDLVFDGLDLQACGGRGYGNCVRVLDGERITIRGGSATDAMGENVALYGGGPGCSTNNGCARQLRDCAVERMTIARGGRAFYDGGGVGTSLGDGVVLKNCERCRVVGNRITDQFTRGIRVNTSQQKTGCTDAPRPDPTSCDWSAGDGSVVRGRCVAGRCATDVCENTGVGCSSDGFLVDANVVTNVGHFQRLDADPARYPRPVSGTADGGCIWVTTVDGIHHASGGWITNNVCRGALAPPRGEPVPGIKVQALSPPAPGVAPVRLVANTITDVNGWCVDLAEAASPIAVVDNLFDHCAGTAPPGLAAGVALPARDVVTHEHNGWSRVAAAARVGVDTVPDVATFEPTGFTADAGFIAPRDGHLRCDAPQRGRGIPVAGVAADVDGDPRPTGPDARWDLGADQARCP